MKTVEISVTAAHIKDGRKGSTCSCPIALAIKDLLPGVDVSVGSATVRFWGPVNNRTELPPTAEDFVGLFDNSFPVEPFTFQLEVPEVES